MTEETYRRLVERSPDGICVHKDGRVLYVNNAGVRLMLADSSDQIVGRPITDFVAPESIPPMVAGIAGLREVGDYSATYPAQMIRLDGTLLAVEVVVVMTIWEDEPAYQVITRDVSVRHETEATLRYQAALVNHVSDAIIGTTATGRGHELESGGRGHLRPVRRRRARPAHHRSGRCPDGPGRHRRIRWHRAQHSPRR